MMSDNNKKPRKPMPRLRSGEEAERFAAEADLTDYDLSGLKPVISSEIDYGDKNVHRPNTYFVACSGESQNRFFTPEDVE